MLTDASPEILVTVIYIGIDTCLPVYPSLSYSAVHVKCILGTAIMASKPSTLIWFDKKARSPLAV
jgi:hypothetical protein